MDRDDVQKDLDEVREQADFAEQGQYQSVEPRIGHCVAAIRKLADLVSKIADTVIP